VPRSAHVSAPYGHRFLSLLIDLKHRQSTSNRLQVRPLESLVAPQTPLERRGTPARCAQRPRSIGTPLLWTFGQPGGICPTGLAPPAQGERWLAEAFRDIEQLVDITAAECLLDRSRITIHEVKLA
jgi:hypothetical protein